MHFEEIVFFSPLLKTVPNTYIVCKTAETFNVCGTVAPLVQKGLECDVARKSSV